MNIFFDLDGTLIDGQERLYKLFINLTQSEKISFKDYWQLKRSMFDHEWILTNIFNYLKSDVQIFYNKWMALIETDEYLKYNKLFDYTIPLLNDLQKHQLYILTARQNKDKVLEETSKFKIQKYFIDILVTNQNGSKEELIVEKGIKTLPEDIFIGDTGIDILAGKKLNIRTIGILSGFRGYEALEKYHPDFILSNISELKSILA